MGDKGEGDNEISENGCRHLWMAPYWTILQFFYQLINIYLFFFQIGLVEKEWLDTLSTINPEEVTYTDYVESGQALAKELRGKGCQFIIALTHMRTPNDIRLAENTTEIDLILGGHDHVYEKKEVYLLFSKNFS